MSLNSSFYRDSGIHQRVVIALVFIANCGAAWAGDWPQFRGSHGSGVSPEIGIPFEWSATKNLRWKAEIPGWGWSSPIIWGNKVFLTTAIPTEDIEQKKGLHRWDIDHCWELLCLRLIDGKLLWKQVVAKGKPIPVNNDNSCASETPVTDGERVYVYLGMLGVYCYGMDGKLLWHNFASFSWRPSKAFPFPDAHHGTSSSPVLEDNRLFLQCDGDTNSGKQSFLVALDAKTGNELWHVKRASYTTWATPFIWHNKYRTEVVALGTQVQSYDPATGKVLWEAFGCKRYSLSPTADTERIYFPVPWEKGDEHERDFHDLVALRAGASGDVTSRIGDVAHTHVTWIKPKARLDWCSPLVYNGRLYVMTSSHRLSCFEAETGKPLYVQQRLPGAAGSFYASFWAYEGQVFCMDETGQTFVVQDGPRFKLLGRNKLEGGGTFWASPAMGRGALLIRGTARQRGVDYLYCFTERAMSPR